MINITIRHKIKIACDIAGISISELAEKMGMSKQNLSKRLKVGKFTQEELQEIAKHLGCKYVSEFHFPNGEKI